MLVIQIENTLTDDTTPHTPYDANTFDHVLWAQSDHLTSREAHAIAVTCWAAVVRRTHTFTLNAQLPKSS